MEVADLVFPRIPLPDWTVTLVVWLAILGMPVAAVLAWALELTPGGVQRTAPAEEEEITAILQGPRGRLWAAGLTTGVEYFFGVRRPKGLQGKFDRPVNG